MGERTQFILTLQHIIMDPQGDLNSAVIPHLQFRDKAPCRFPEKTQNDLHYSAKPQNNLPPTVKAHQSSADRTHFFLKQHSGLSSGPTRTTFASHSLSAALQREFYYFLKKNHGTIRTTQSESHSLVGSNLSPKCRACIFHAVLHPTVCGRD